MVGQLELILSACEECAALVADTDEAREKHVKWHEKLAKTAQQASYADAMTRPIGGRGW